MTKLIIGLIGYSGSGKSVFTEVARDKYNIVTISTGEFVRNEVNIRGLDITL